MTVSHVLLYSSLQILSTWQLRFVGNHPIPHSTPQCLKEPKQLLIGQERHFHQIVLMIANNTNNSGDTNIQIGSTQIFKA